MQNDLNGFSANTSDLLCVSVRMLFALMQTCLTVPIVLRSPGFVETVSLHFDGRFPAADM